MRVQRGVGRVPAAEEEVGVFRRGGGLTPAQRARALLEELGESFTRSEHLVTAALDEAVVDAIPEAESMTNRAVDMERHELAHPSAR